MYTFFTLKVRLQELKFEFCQIKLGNLQVTDKISLKFAYKIRPSVTLSA